MGNDNSRRRKLNSVEFEHGHKSSASISHLNADNKSFDSHSSSEEVKVTSTSDLPTDKLDSTHEHPVSSTIEKSSLEEFQIRLACAASPGDVSAQDVDVLKEHSEGDLHNKNFVLKAESSPKLVLFDKINVESSSAMKNDCDCLVKLPAYDEDCIELHDDITEFSDWKAIRQLLNELLEQVESETSVLFATENIDSSALRKCSDTVLSKPEINHEKYSSDQEKRFGTQNELRQNISNAGKNASKSSNPIFSSSLVLSTEECHLGLTGNASQNEVFELENISIKNFEQSICMKTNLESDACSVVAVLEQIVDRVSDQANDSIFSEVSTSTCSVAAVLEQVLDRVSHQLNNSTLIEVSPSTCNVAAVLEQVLDRVSDQLNDSTLIEVSTSTSTPCIKPPLKSDQVDENIDLNIIANSANSEESTCEDDSFSSLADGSGVTELASHSTDNSSTIQLLNIPNTTSAAEPNNAKLQLQFFPVAVVEPTNAQKLDKSDISPLMDFTDIQLIGEVEPVCAPIPISESSPMLLSDHISTQLYSKAKLDVTEFGDVTLLDESTIAEPIDAQFLSETKTDVVEKLPLVSTINLSCNQFLEEAASDCMTQSTDIQLFDESKRICVLGSADSLTQGKLMQNSVTEVIDTRLIDENIPAVFLNARSDQMLVRSLVPALDPTDFRLLEEPTLLPFIKLDDAQLISSFFVGESTDIQFLDKSISAVVTEFEDIQWNNKPLVPVQDLTITKSFEASTQLPIAAACSIQDLDEHISSPVWDSSSIDEPSSICIIKTTEKKSLDKDSPALITYPTDVRMLDESVSESQIVTSNMVDESLVVNAATPISVTEPSSSPLHKSVLVSALNPDLFLSDTPMLVEELFNANQVPEEAMSSEMNCEEKPLASSSYKQEELVATGADHNDHAFCCNERNSADANLTIDSSLLLQEFPINNELVPKNTLQDPVKYSSLETVTVQMENTDEKDCSNLEGVAAKRAEYDNSKCFDESVSFNREHAHTGLNASDCVDDVVASKNEVNISASMENHKTSFKILLDSESKKQKAKLFDKAVRLFERKQDDERNGLPAFKVIFGSYAIILLYTCNHICLLFLPTSAAT